MRIWQEKSSNLVKLKEQTFPIQKMAEQTLNFKNVAAYSLICEKLTGRNV